MYRFLHRLLLPVLSRSFGPVSSVACLPCRKDVRLPQLCTNVSRANLLMPPFPQHPCSCFVLEFIISLWPLPALSSLRTSAPYLQNIMLYGFPLPFHACKYVQPTASPVLSNKHPCTCVHPTAAAQRHVHHLHPCTCAPGCYAHVCPGACAAAAVPVGGVRLEIPAGGCW